MLTGNTMNKKKLYYVLLTLILLIIIIYIESIVKNNNKRIKIVGALDPTYPPFEYIEKETNNIIGLDIDLVNAIAKEIGIDIEIRGMSYGGIMPALLVNQIDFIASPITITEERKNNVNFTQEISNGNSSMLVHENNKTINTLDDLKGKRIGVRLGSASSDFAHLIIGAEVTDFDNGYVMVLMLINNKIDVIIDEYLVNIYTIDKNISEVKLKIAGTPFNPKDINNPKVYAFAISKNNKKLLKRFNDAITKLKENGELKRIYLDVIKNQL
jgi:polar amino acid transport system substrate-binding protein